MWNPFKKTLQTKTFEYPVSLIKTIQYFSTYNSCLLEQRFTASAISQSTAQEVYVVKACLTQMMLLGLLNPELDNGYVYFIPTLDLVTIQRHKLLT